MKNLYKLNISLLSIGIALSMSLFCFATEYSASSHLAYSSELKFDSLLDTFSIAREKQLKTRAIYMSGSIIVSGEAKIKSFLSRFQQSIDNESVNTVILDIKENSVIYFKIFEDEELKADLVTSDLKLLKSLTHSKAANLARTIELIKEHGLRVVARVVIMKDKKIARLRPNWALKSRATGNTWGNLNWLNPWSEGLKSFYYDMSLRLARAGVEEIQLDYIRMPGGEDGRSKDRLFTGRGNDKLCEGIPKFLKGLKNKLQVNNFETRLGVDVFGYIANGKNYCSGVGQHLGMIGPYIDVVWPMQYPSHWAVKNQKGFGTYHPENVPQKIYRITTKNIRKQFNKEDAQRIEVIPWVQAFYLKRFAGVTMESPVRGMLSEYVIKQLDGIVEGGGDGFALWGTPSGQVSSMRKPIND